MNPMTAQMVPLATMPRGLVWALAGVELVLLVLALVVWLRTPPERFTGNRWAWLAALFLLSMIGPITFLLFGRRPPPADDPTTSGGPGGPAGRTDDVADLLYGKRK